eukprot:SAG22_NODE_2601_length_2397_cov_15.406440_1_plen_33_part_00
MNTLYPYRLCSEAKKHKKKTGKPPQLGLEVFL